MLKERIWYIQKISKLLVRPWFWGVRNLKESDLNPNPFDQFSSWFNRAQKSFWLVFPEAMCLATLGEDGLPDTRMVLMKDFNKDGFTFYTNSLSRKGDALKLNPVAALNFYWEPLARQVRVQGRVVEVSESESDEYFSTRPHLSQIGAWASKQSSILDNRNMLDAAVEELREKYKDKKIPRPEYWRGYRILPERFEFWQMRVGRLHDRFQYTKGAAGDWEITRLYP